MIVSDRDSSDEHIPLLIWWAMEKCLRESPDETLDVLRQLEETGSDGCEGSHQDEDEKHRSESITDPAVDAVTHVVGVVRDDQDREMYQGQRDGGEDD